eukprot:2614297-Amphidinium_carterae.1
MFHARIVPLAPFLSGIVGIALWALRVLGAACMWTKHGGATLPRTSEVTSWLRSGAPRSPPFCDDSWAHHASSTYIAVSDLCAPPETRRLRLT